MPSNKQLQDAIAQGGVVGCPGDRLGSLVGSVYSHEDHRSADSGVLHRSSSFASTLGFADLPRQRLWSWP